MTTVKPGNNIHIGNILRTEKTSVSHFPYLAERLFYSNLDKCQVDIVKASWCFRKNEGSICGVQMCL